MERSTFYLPDGVGFCPVLCPKFDYKVKSGTEVLTEAVEKSLMPFKVD